MFVLLVPPAAGDGLQGIKRGIMELADLVVVTKGDGELKGAARTMARELRGALQLLRPRSPQWLPRVVTTSVHDPDTISKVASVIAEYRDVMGASGALAERRREQAVQLVWEHARTEVLQQMGGAPAVDRLVRELAEQSAAGSISASQAGAAVATEVSRAWSLLDDESAPGGSR